MYDNDDGNNRNPKKFGRELEKRTRKFAVRIIRLSVTLLNTPDRKKSEKVFLCIAFYIN